MERTLDATLPYRGGRIVTLSKSLCLLPHQPNPAHPGNAPPVPAKSLSAPSLPPTSTLPSIEPNVTTQTNFSPLLTVPYYVRSAPPPLSSSTSVIPQTVSSSVPPFSSSTSTSQTDLLSSPVALSQYFRNKLGPNASTSSVVHLVRAAQGFWQAASPQHALDRKRFSTDFVGKIYLDHHVAHNMQSKGLASSSGHSRKTAALKKTAGDLNISEAEVRDEYRRRRNYMILLARRGPGFLLLIGTGVTSL